MNFWKKVEKTCFLVNLFVEDGKYRYIKSERIKIYTMLYNQLKSKSNDLFVYFCMERSDIWKAVTGINLYNNEGLIKLFDKRIHDLYGGIL